MRHLAGQSTRNVDLSDTQMYTYIQCKDTVDGNEVSLNQGATELYSNCLYSQ